MRFHALATCLVAAASAAAFRLACVGASGTCAGLRAANSLRKVGNTSSPKRSSCSNTVFSGKPAWSIKKSCRELNRPGVSGDFLV
ncbi:hypothetical protein RSal33209_1537 [Renibacterium salmoninarum ATCC 33209]|uniref:Secreted protein n=1 Tax=Renibacterium salmoninarum (strain ATCC 33209 / DSM 20767 / JCM 11484 / NBRC 15589 / NCIMB 2235) TaxID=288705 RepID=A9WNS5_RENSM|nr:hypothetical protein RSal33209_1537 [Renibacterium salmoninarum ATCC 33209]